MQRYKFKCNDKLNVKNQIQYQLQVKNNRFTIEINLDWP